MGKNNGLMALMLHASVAVLVNYLGNVLMIALILNIVDPKMKIALTF